tara:strand:+ start:50 stop:238 length:189 start_codon:yes stop_codon:yes gene_type:complete
MDDSEKPVSGKWITYYETKIEEVLRIVNKSLQYGKAGEGPDDRTTVVWLKDNMKEIKKILEE